MIRFRHYSNTYSLITYSLIELVSAWLQTVNAWFILLFWFSCITRFSKDVKINNSRKPYGFLDAYLEEILIKKSSLRYSYRLYPAEGVGWKIIKLINAQRRRKKTWKLNLKYGINVRYSIISFKTSNGN